MSNEMQTTPTQQSSQLAATSIHHQHSLQLIAYLVRTESAELAFEAKMELIAMVSDLMPDQEWSLAAMLQYPTIATLAKENGKQSLLKAIFLLLKDFCASMNVSRNMNELQMIEAASMMFDECGKFTLEDYLIMFEMAKRGKLVKLMHTIDISLIGNMMEEYRVIRRHATDREIQALRLEKELARRRGDQV